MDSVQCTEFGVVNPSLGANTSNAEGPSVRAAVVSAIWLFLDPLEGLHDEGGEG